MKDDQLYLVRFPNGKSKRISADELQVRCRLPIAEPTDHLASQCNETAFWHASRSEFVRHLLEQHTLSRGLSALLSSSVEIVAHQASVIHRVLMDPFQRYLLADEVGLGKTIDAGVLIKQFALDEPHDHQTIIIVPDSLQNQWKEELTHRFHLGLVIGVSIHIVSSHDAKAIATLIPSARMIVIDEAHHLSSWAWSTEPAEKSIFDTVKHAAGKVNCRVLLLSATPVLHNEHAFLAMLHLLDPQVYPLDSLDLFKMRVRLRQEIAERMLDLREEESNFFLGDTINVLGDLLVNDHEFQNLQGQLAELIKADIDEKDPQRNSLIRSIRTHVSDMWRLHRRILRNRRTESTSVYLPGRDVCEQITYECEHESGLANAIEAWRLTLSSALFSATENEKAAASQLARVMDEFAACDPRHALKLSVERLQGGGSDEISKVPLCEGEVETLGQILRAAKECGQVAKLRRLARLLGTDDSAIPYVVFTNFPETADLVFEFLVPRLTPGRVLRHSTKNSAWTQFKSEHRGYVLVCDHTAEEGLNLQKRKAYAIHYDLPFSPNRIEQRMGRLDRFGSGTPVKSAVLVCGGSSVQQNWFHLLDDALGVFQRSIASLQYVIDKEMQKVWAEFLDSGADAFVEAIGRLGGNEGVVASEFKQIRAQDQIDSFDTDLITQKIADDLESNDRKLSPVFREAFKNWAIRNLRFRKTGEEGRTDEVFTYEFTRKVDVGVKKPFGRDTLMPADEFQRQFRDSIDSLKVEKPTVFISVPFSFDRVVAQQRSCRLLRVGDPFVDAFEAFTRWDDRGISYAFWRYIPNYRGDEDPNVFFRFDYVVSPAIAPLQKLCDQHAGVSRNAILRRTRAIMQPRFTTIWLDSDLDRVIPNDDRFSLLTPTFNKHATGRRRDFNLNSDRWSAAAQLYDMS